MLIKWKKCPNCQGYHDPTLEKCPRCHKHNELYLDRKISNNIAFMHPAAQIGLFLAGFSFGGMFIAELIVALFLQGIADELLYKTMVISITYLLMFLGLSLIIIFTRRDYFFKKYKRAIDYIYGLGYAITIVLVSMIVASIINLFQPVTENANQEAAVAVTQNYPILAFFVLGIIGPICEELTYRVGLYSFLRRFNKYFAIAFSSIVFALIHFDLTVSIPLTIILLAFLFLDLPKSAIVTVIVLAIVGFNIHAVFNEASITELIAFPSYLVSGVILTLAYEHRGPACSMTAHIAYNIFALVLMLAS